MITRRSRLQSVWSRLALFFARRTAGTKNQQYDLETLAVIKQALDRDSVGVDIGAHTGQILKEILAAAPEGIHYAFEPIPALARDLKVRFPQVRVHECALSDRKGESFFQHVVNEPAYSGLRQREYDRPDPQIEQLRVVTDRLDDVIPADSRVSFIKLDVEGGEYHVLLGGLETIRRGTPVIVFEASVRTTGKYDVSSDDMYDLITKQCGLSLSTMRRWLDSEAPLSQSEFEHHWEYGSEFYFIAYHPSKRASLSGVK